MWSQQILREHLPARNQVGGPSHWPFNTEHVQLTELVGLVSSDVFGHVQLVLRGGTVQICADLGPVLRPSVPGRLLQKGRGDSDHWTRDWRQVVL